MEVSPAGGGDGWHERAIGILLEVVESMTAAQGEGAALDRLASLALKATSADRCAILVRDPHGLPRLLPASGASRVGDDLDDQLRKFRSMAPIDVGSDPARSGLWEVEGTIALTDVADSPLVPEEWKRIWGSKSLAFTSLRADGKVFGLLAVDYLTQHHVFTSGEERLLDAIACAAGVALRSARLVSRLQRSIEVERRLAECTAAVQSGRSLSEVLDLVVDRFATLVVGRSHAISLLSQDGSSVRTVAYRGPDPARRLIRLSELPEQDVAEARRLWTENPRRPILVDDARSRPGWLSLVPPQIGPAALIPLWDGRVVLGFVAVGREERPFTEEEIRLATAFAGQAALAVAQARLHDKLRARLRAIEVLHRLSEVVIRTSDLRSVLPLLNRGVCGEMGVKCLRMVFSHPSLAELTNGRRPTPEEGLLLRAWRAADVPEPEQRDDQLAVPIPVGGRIAGILWLAGADVPDPTLIEFLRAIAGGLGEVAYKAKLRRAVDQRTRELVAASERERIARDLHDTVGQTFYGIGLQLQELLLRIDDPDLAEQLGRVRARAAQAVADVRSAVYALSFLHVQARGLVPSLRALARQLEKACGIHVELRVDGQGVRIPEEVQSALYRVAHEALVNVERHARATGVVVDLSMMTGAVELRIRDDGVGLGQREGVGWQSAAHFGMRSMAKAVEEVGGRFRAINVEPRGLLIVARVPLGPAGAGSAL